MGIEFQFHKTKKFWKLHNVNLIIIIFFHFWPPHGIWISQAQDQIQGTITTEAAAAATLDPLTHCARLGIKPMSQCFQEAADPLTPQRELQHVILNTAELYD